MKLNEIIPELQDLSKLGIIPHREGLEENETYFYPPFITLTESGNTQPLSIRWTKEANCLNGDFQTEQYQYQIQICAFTYPFQGKVYKCANVAFVCLVNGKPTTEVIPTEYYNQVLSTVQNGISEKIVTLRLDAISLVATNNIQRRMRVYNRLANKYGIKFGIVYKNIKTLTGLATIIISYRVPEKIRQAVYNFAVKRSEEKI